MGVVPGPPEKERSKEKRIDVLALLWCPTVRTISLGCGPWTTGKRKKQRKTNRCVSFALFTHGKDQNYCLRSLDRWVWPWPPVAGPLATKLCEFFSAAVDVFYVHNRCRVAGVFFIQPTVLHRIEDVTAGFVGNASFYLEGFSCFGDEK